MARISDYVTAPYNGVSQVPPALRPDDTCEVMEDCQATIPIGLQKRPPMFLQAFLEGVTLGPSPLWVEVPRGSLTSDVSLLINHEGGLNVPHLYLTSTGAAIPLTITDAAKAYLAANAPTVPNQQFRTVSIEDFTFIANRTVQVMNGSSTSPVRNPEALLWVKIGQYGRQYTVTVTPDGGTPVTASFRTPSGDQSSDAQWVDTNVILEQLYQYGSTSGIPGQSFPEDDATWTGDTLNTLTGFNLVLTGSTLYIQSQTSADFTISTSDGQGDAAMYAIKGSVQSFDQLPLVGHDGMIVEIEQSAAGGDSNFYVTYSANGSLPSGGVWIESVGQGVPLGVDPTTLPIAITVNETTNVWTCDVVAWTGRTVGDLNTVPDPGFIEDSITDIRWWRGRLALIYNGGVVLSASDSPFKFYTTTLAAALDSDPIGLLTPADRKTFFKQAFTFDQRFFVFADRVQAAVSAGASPVTPTTTSMTLMAESAFSDLAPVQKGNHKARYLAPRGLGKAQATVNSIVYVLAIDRLSGLALEQDRSAAIPNYIPASIDTAATWEADYLTFWGTSGSTAIYVANYREEEFQAVQNGYWRWNLPTGYTLGGFYIKDGVIYILTDTPQGTAAFFTMDTSPNQLTQGRDSTASSIRQFLDVMLDDSLLVAEGPSHAGGPTQTTLTLPFAISNPMVTLRAPWSGWSEGHIIPIAATIGSQVILQGSWIGAPLWIGIPYASQFTPSTWFYKGQDKRVQHDGRLSMKRLKVDLSDYGYMRAVVNLKGRFPRNYVFNGYFQDDPYTPTDAPPQSETATLMVPLGGRNTDLQVTFISDSNLGFKFLGYEWVGDWNPRSRRVT